MAGFRETAGPTEETVVDTYMEKTFSVEEEGNHIHPWFFKRPSKQRQLVFLPFPAGHSWHGCPKQLHALAHGLETMDLSR